jgi:L-lactate dehydrogenase (cytochrome)
LPCSFSHPPTHHPTGEKNIIFGTVTSSPPHPSIAIPTVVSSNASLSSADIIASAAPGQTLFFQLYKHSDDARAESRVRMVESLGYKAIWLTVDAIVFGNREKDVRAQWEIEKMEKGEEAMSAEGNAREKDLGVNLGGTAGAMVMNDDQDMTWEKVSQIVSLVPEDCRS